MSCRMVYMPNKIVVYVEILFDLKPMVSTEQEMHISIEELFE